MEALNRSNGSFGFPAQAQVYINIFLWTLENWLWFFESFGIDKKRKKQKHTHTHTKLYHNRFVAIILYPIPSEQTIIYLRLSVYSCLPKKSYSLATAFQQQWPSISLGVDIFCTQCMCMLYGPPKVIHHIRKIYSTNIFLCLSRKWLFDC